MPGTVLVLGIGVCGLSLTGSFGNVQLGMSWNEDGGLTVTRVSTDSQGEQAKGEITAPLEEWLNIVVGVLSMLPGKPDPTGQGYVLGPANADPDMIGALIAAKLKEHPPYGGGY